MKEHNIIGLSISEFFIYILATMGFSDYALNTAVFKKTGWVKDEVLPGTLIVCDLCPGVVNAIIYLTGGVAFEWPTLIVSSIVTAIGSFFGSRMMLKLDVKKLRKIIGYAMIFSMASLIVKLILSQGEAGTATGLHGWQWYIAVPIFFIMGFINNFAVGLKPPIIAMFLLMGVSPLATLTFLMCLSVTGPATGAVQVFKTGKYHKDAFRSAYIFGTIGAIIGSRFALNVNPTILTIVMLLVLAYVSYTMLISAYKR